LADLLLFYSLDAWLVVVAMGVPIGLLAGLPDIDGGMVAVLRPYPGFDLIGGCDRHVRALALALKLGTGDRPVIYQARDRCSSWRTTLARAVGDVTLSCLAGALAACALCRARCRALVGARASLALASPVWPVPSRPWRSVCCCLPEMALGQERGIVVI
jgi:hypothetical protein